MMDENLSVENRRKHIISRDNNVQISEGEELSTSEELEDC